MDKKKTEVEVDVLKMVQDTCMRMIGKKNNKKNIRILKSNLVKILSEQLSQVKETKD